MGDWERKSTGLWIYELRDSRGRRMPFGHVQRRQPHSGNGADWEAIVHGEGVGDDVLLRRQVFFAEATEAVEQAAAAVAGAPPEPWEDEQAAT